MATSTTNFNLRKPAGTDPVDVDLDIAGNMDDIDTAIAGRAAVSHTHTEANVTNLTTDLAGKAASSHTHTESDVTSLATDLSGKAAASHTHAEADVTSLATDLAAKAATSHTHAESDVTNLGTDLTAKLSNSLVDAKGDILTASADNTPARLAVGVAGNFLTPDTTATTGLKWTQRSTMALSYLEVVDDFLDQNTANGDVGQLAWRTGGSGGSLSVVPGTAAHPGITVLSSGASLNRFVSMGDSTDQPFIGSDVDRFIMVVKVVTITTVQVYVGLMQDNQTTPPGTAGAYFSFDPAVNANWQTITRNASTSTTNTSTIAVTAGNWYQLEGRKNGANWEMYINGTLRFTHSTNLPATASLSPGFFINATAASSRDLQVDFFALTAVLGQRWT